jgi:undecaprenyl-diphosphatase
MTSAPEEITPPASPRWPLGWIASVGLILAAGGVLVGSFYLDAPVVAGIRSTVQAKSGKTLFAGGELQRVLRFFESYGHGLGAAAAFLIVGFAASRWRTALRLAAAVGMAAAPYFLLSRVLIRRCRPHAWAAWAAGNVWSTFGVKGASFPSGHTGTAAAFSIVLAAAFPRGRWIFLILAALCGVARVLTLDHYVSDVVAGAILGAAAGLLAVYSPSLTRLLDRIVGRFERRGAA